MDFELTPDQVSLQEGARRFAESLNGDDVRQGDDHQFLLEAWKRCASFGVQGMCVPAEFGGGEADPITITVVLEALGYGCRDGGLLFSLNAHMWSCEVPLVNFASDELKHRYLPGLCDGSLIGVQAMTEPDSGSDAFSLSTSARRVAGGYVLNGTKTFITNAPVANVFIVFVTTDRELGFGGISAFVVDRNTEGLSVGKPFRKMGLRSSPMSELVFSDCEVGSDRLLGPEGAGMAIFTASMDWERSFILASAVGTMERQLERAVMYSRTRRQFGRPIGKFQHVARRVVDMKIRLETARLLQYRLSWLRTKGKPAAHESAMVKLYLSESYLQSSLDAVQVHGAFGYMEDSGVEVDVRDAIGSRIYSGTSEIQRNVIAHGMGL